MMPASRRLANARNGHRLGLAHLGNGERDCGEVLDSRADGKAILREHDCATAFSYRKIHKDSWLHNGGAVIMRRMIDISRGFPTSSSSLVVLP